ncbi:MAG: SDR family NAD(P)-dependent oxidoreductase [Coprobacillaceae bacterium]
MNRVAIINGGSSGIGKATARIFAEKYKVVIAGRNVDKLNKAVIELYDQGADVIPIKCDVTDIDSVNTLAKEAANLGSIEVVVNCAGVSPSIGD